MSSRYRAVVIGCGHIGSTFAAEARAPGIHCHAQAYRTHPRTALVGVADTDPRRLAQAQAMWASEADCDGIALCRRLRPEMVSICTPDDTHAEIAHRLLRESAPRLLFIEKPLAVASEEAAQLLELAERQDCAITVNYSRRFSPAFQAIAEELRSGAHGRPRLARVLYGKGLLHNGSHALDLLRWWFGEPLSLTAQTAATPPDDDSYTADLGFADGFRARLDPYEAAVATVFEMDVLTERSRWRWWLGGDRWEFSEVRESPSYEGYRNYVVTDRAQTDRRFLHPLAECLRYAVDNLVDFLDGRATLHCTGTDGLEALRWVERIRQADERLSTRR